MVAIQYFSVFLILELTLMSHSLVHHLETNEGYLNFRAHKEPLGILYYHHHANHGDFRSRTKAIMEATDGTMDEFPFRFMKLATVNCLSNEITKKDISGCSTGIRQFLVYKPNVAEPEKFSLRSLHDQDAFIGEMVYFIYSGEISIVDVQDEWEQVLNSGKGKNDIVFMYLNGLGSAEHYEYMVFFLRNRHKYIFTFTTDDDFANQLGKNITMTKALWFFRCSALAENSKEQCPSEVLSDSKIIEASTIEFFIKTQKLPVVFLMSENGSTVYDGIDNINVMYVFVQSEEEAETMTHMVYNVITRCKGNGIQLRGVIVDRRLHKKIMAEVFGVTMDTMLPTIMVEMRSEGSESKTREMEAFIPDEDLVEDNLFGFVYKLVKNRVEYDNSIAAMNYIHCIKVKEWDEMRKHKHDTLIGVCTKDMENENICKTFRQNFRHIVRIMYSDRSLNFEYIYIDKSDDEQKGFDTPSMELFVNGNTRKLDKEKRDIGEMLNWVNSELKINLPMLPSSGSDRVSLPPQSRLDENSEIITDESSDDLFPYQEDEIALAALKVRRAKFYVDDTLSLTDETFQKTINMSKLLLAFFYIPQIDDISLLFEPIIATVSKKVQNDVSPNLIPAKVAKINCENEYLACLGAGVHTFPTIQFYSEGVMVGKYDRLLDEKRLMETLRLYQQPALQKLTEDSLPNFIQSAMENSGSQLSVLGWFEKENEDFQLYKKASDKFFGKIAFAYVTGDEGKAVFPKVLSSTVVAYVQSQISGVLSGAMDRFTETRLDEFLMKAQVPKFGELTVENFPVYKSFNKSMLVLFLQKDHKVTSKTWNTISQLVQEKTMESILLTWMNTDTSVGKEIRRSYIGIQKEKHEDVVIVDFTRAEVYHYPTLSDVSYLHTWIQNCLDGQVKATKYLNVLKWKPLRPGFDFLHMIDNNQRYPGDKGEYADSRENFPLHGDGGDGGEMGHHGNEIDEHAPTVSGDEMDIDEDSETSSEKAPRDRDQGSIPADFATDNELDVEIHKQRNEL